MESIIGSPNSGATVAGGAPGDLIKESNTQSFRQDVLEASMQVPVLVDFWAAWCGPCKQLGPALERAVQQARGSLRLVKIDVDKNQALAQQLRIQSIPTVYAFFQGQPIDGFQGALPESQVKEFINRVIQVSGGQAPGEDLAAMLSQAEELHANGEFQAAAQIFMQVLQQDQENAAAIGGLLRCRIALGDRAGARQVLDELPEDLKSKPEIQAAVSALELAEEVADSGDVAELMERVAHDPNDHQSRFELAQALYAAGKREAAAEELLEIVRRQRNWNEDAARKQLLKYFEAWGPSDPLTLETRRRLSSLLFA